LHLPLPTTPGSFDAVHLDFECGTLAGWNLKRLVGPHSAIVQSCTKRVGANACRFELRPGDFVSEGHRAELRDPFNAPFEIPVWYGFSTFLDSRFPVDEGVGCVMAQWHDQAKLGDPSGKPPIAVRYRAGRLAVTGAYGKVASDRPERRYEFASIENLPRGVWHDFVFRVVWSRFGESRLSAWLCGREWIDWSGPLGYQNEAEGPYFKLGVYCSGPIRRVHVVYHDNFSRGHSFAEVDPARLHTAQPVNG
jgi:peptide/nickel transport system ATP-binding protein